MTEKTFIDRPPRIEPALPSGIHPIPNPPEMEERAGDVLLQAFLPLVMIFGYILMALFGQGRNLLMMIPMLLSVVASISLTVYARSQQAKRRRQLAEMNLRRLSELRRKMQSEHEQQRIYYYHNYPNPDTNLAIAEDLERSPNQREEDLRSGSRLWERRPADHDFMHLRLGVSNRPSSVIYKVSENEKTDSALMQEAIRLADDSVLLRSAPVTIALYRPTGKKENKPAAGEAGEAPAQPGNDINVRHALGITGPKPVVYDYARTLLIEYATFHSPEDTILYIAGNIRAKAEWNWAYPLPHCKKADRTNAIWLEENQKPGENQADPLRLFFKEIRTILERRRIRLQDKDSGGDNVQLPFLLLVVDLLEEPEGWSCLKETEAEAAISTILLEGQTLGAGVLFLSQDRSKIPSRCTAVIEADSDPRSARGAVFRYAETGLNTIRYLGQTAPIVTAELAESFSKKLAPLEIRRGYGSSLASVVTLFELLNAQTRERLYQLALEHWRTSKDPACADWMKATVGLLSGNEPRTLTFSSDADGSHGMIAGSTGSGKSELLMTLILSLAINHDPSVLNFVLIDYKGGSAFEPFKNLPHVVDIVTNLDASSTARVFASIIAELNRRQEILKNTNSKHLVHYRAKGLSLKPDQLPFPHLFIIIDEFAEMISSNAEYKAQLSSITRLGRALGVTLILAAQRPVGVTDQMRANIKMRICLRVETPDESREMLRRTDAAFLPTGIPGRGYLQIGNENIELIQTAYTGNEYRGPGERGANPSVKWIDRPKRPGATSDTESKKAYEVIVNLLEDLGKTESKKQVCPWPEFLPRQEKGEMLTLQTPLDTTYINDKDKDQELLRMFDDVATVEVTLNEMATRFWKDGFCWRGITWDPAKSNAMKPLVGLVDDPYNAQQKPLAIRFTEGHAAIFGMSGRGKTTFLRTTIASLALTHSPDELHIYIMDFGGRSLGVFEDLPHVGAFITANEEERVRRLLRKLEEIIKNRQLKMTKLDAYNLKQEDSAKRLPAILVVIDNFGGFREYFDSQVSDLVGLMREGFSLGIYFLFAADVPATLTGKIMNLIPWRYTLKLADPAEYSNVVGRGVPADLNMVPGRGYLRDGNQPLEFQTALAFDPDENETDDQSKIEQMVARMKQLWNNGWKGQPPAEINVLRPRISLQELLDKTGQRPSYPLTVPIGIDDRSLEIAWLNVEGFGPHRIIIGPPSSGRTTVLRTLLIGMAATYGPSEFKAVLIDFNDHLWKGRDCSLADLPQVIEVVNETAQLDGLLAHLKTECADLKVHPGRPKIVLLIDNYDSFSDESSRKNADFFDGVAALLRKYQTDGFFVFIAGSLSITTASEELRKVAANSGTGYALLSPDAVNRMNGRFPRHLSEKDLPMGRAFRIHSSRTEMLQIASPYVNDDSPEEGIDPWVERIRRKYPGQRADWLDGAALPGAPQGPNRPDLTGEARPPAKRTYDYADLRKKLKEHFIPDEVINPMTDSAVEDMARHLGVIRPEADKE